MSSMLAESQRRGRQSSFSSHRLSNVTTVPWIREATLGQNLGNRAKALADQKTLTLGPADLIHWARQYGERSSHFLKNDFSPISEADPARDQDGYVGFFHFSNGLDLAQGTDSIEKQVLHSIGLRRNGESYIWAPKKTLASRLGLAQHKEGVVTFCAYNCFQKLEFRARYIVTPSSKTQSVVVNSQYTITSKVSKKLHTYVGEHCQEITLTFLRELAVLLLIRMLVGVDDPAHRLLGTVSHKTQLQGKEQLHNTIDLLVSYLPKGHLTGTRSHYGVACNSGTDPAKTTKYRNRLVDALVRVVLLDARGSATDLALEKIRAKFAAREFTAVEVRLLRAQHGSNNHQKFLSLVRDHLAVDTDSTQAAILIGEQVRFLISQESFSVARQLAVRAVSMLPLDFDSWYNLCVCYILEKKYDDALQTLNSLPVLLQTKKSYDGDCVDGIADTYVLTFMDRLSRGHIPIGAKTFVEFFPEPRNDDMVEAGSVQSVWRGMFKRESARHPMVGPFYQSSLTTASPIEMSAIDSGLIRVSGPSSAKNMLAARSANVPWASILDFDRKSTWGRAYDLLTSLVALIGWENLVAIKQKVFRSPGGLIQDKEFVVSNTSSAQREECGPWLEQLFLVVYDDIHAMMNVSGGTDPNHHRSALAWGIIGLVSWACKYNLKDSISSLATCAAGVTADGGFDYYATVKLLEIYNEFVLSNVEASTIDLLNCVFDNHSYTNKLIVQSILAKMFRDFVHQLVNGYMALETMLVHIMKLVAWELRWYNYVPSYLVTNTLIKLCQQRDPVEVRTLFRVVFEKFKLQAVDSKLNKFSFLAWFGGSKKKADQPHDFVNGDTVIDYIDDLLMWIEQLG